VKLTSSFVEAPISLIKNVPVLGAASSTIKALLLGEEDPDALVAVTQYWVRNFLPIKVGCGALGLIRGLVPDTSFVDPARIPRAPLAKPPLPLGKIEPVGELLI
jgi:hypothetical protein